MSDFFEVVQNLEACPKCKDRRDRDNYPLWTGALWGWDHGCRACFDLIDALRLSDFGVCGLCKKIIPRLEPHSCGEGS